MQFIIYGSNEVFIRKCKEKITSLMISENFDYKIKNYKKFNKKVISNEHFKIYIINSEKGLDIAMDIRESGDWMSPILLFDGKGMDYGYTEYLLRLDIINNLKKLGEKIRCSIDITKMINNTKKNISFSYKGESHLIPYDIILYIEKKINDNSSVIITDDDEICIPKSITALFDELDKESFYKSHRSCLINIDRVSYIDYDLGIISFGEKKTNLLSRSNKKILKEIFSNKYKK